MKVLKTDFIELARTIYDFIGWIYFQEYPHNTSFHRPNHREEFVKWFMTLSEIRFIDPAKLNSHLHPDYLQGGTGIGKTGSGAIVSSYTGGTGGIIEPRELKYITGGTGGTGLHTQIYTGGVGFDYGIMSKETYGNNERYKLFHNRYYPLIYNLGPSGKFNRDIYQYNSSSNKRFMIFHISWDVFDDPKDEYSPEEYDIRMTFVERVNRGLYPLTLYYLALLFDQKLDIRDYLEKTFVQRYETNKILDGSQTTVGSKKGYNEDDGYFFYDTAGATPIMPHHHDSRYYSKDEFLEKFYDKIGIQNYIEYVERVIRSGDDIRHDHDDIYYTREKIDILLYPKETIDLKIINLEQSLKDYLEGLL